ncbi:hypothetical protein QL285_023833 [Trifolium repens]|jgi:hypothetical protein|nr:hypothetical protein QL285_023833 [Trifolium repens]
MVATTRRIMDNRLECVEQRTSMMEATIEQMRQMMVEMLARPQISLEQVHQLIETQPRRRNRQTRHDNEVWSDHSAVSSGSRCNQGGHHLRVETLTESEEDE